mmetsp:Transcript_6706/g.18012  ORF Transcript_6706/g.18012 Transcript_6706/m.18012 type:complete len:314 (-) Transcript_6706:25-966(-)
MLQSSGHPPQKHPMLLLAGASRAPQTLSCGAVMLVVGQSLVFRRRVGAQALRVAGLGDKLLCAWRVGVRHDRSGSRCEARRPLLGCELERSWIGSKHVRDVRLRGRVRGVRPQQQRVERAKQARYAFGGAPLIGVKDGRARTAGGVNVAVEYTSAKAQMRRAERVVWRKLDVDQKHAAGVRRLRRSVHCGHPLVHAVALGPRAETRVASRAHVLKLALDPFGAFRQTLRAPAVALCSGGCAARALDQRELSKRRRVCGNIASLGYRHKSSAGSLLSERTAGKDAIGKISGAMFRGATRSRAGQRRRATLSCYA